MECRRLVSKLIVLVLLMSTLSCTCVLASWDENGNAVCTATGFQYSPYLVSDGAGGAIMTWMDDRGIDRNIYAARLDAYGNMLWTVDGVAICTATGSQSGPQITSDGAEGAIIAWQDDRSGSYSDVYARRVDASGDTLWSGNGVAVCTATGNQYSPRIASDGAGGGIIAWQDYRSGSADVYARRVDASGDTLWTGNGVAVCTATGDQQDIQIMSDGAGGAFIVWQDRRSGSWDIYALRVNASGSVIGPMNGVPICTATGDQYCPQLTSDGAGGAIIVWHDSRGTDWDVYAQRLSTYMSVLWTADGVAISNATSSQCYPQLTSDGAGGAIITWQDRRSGNYDIYAARADASGAVLWTGIALCVATGDQEKPQITSDGIGGAIITWYDLRGASYDIYAGRVDASGTPQWTPDGEAICTATGGQYMPEITSDAAGGGIIAWWDERTGSRDTYSQRIERNGYWGYPSASIRSVRDLPGDEGGHINLAWDACRLDPWPEMLITEYTVWRAVSAEAVAGMVEEGAYVLTATSDGVPKTESSVLRVEEAGGETLYWKLMSTIDAYYLDAYSEVVFTLFDSTSACDEHHYFQVIAHTNTPSMFWVSEPDSGYSVDNLSPDAPQGVSGDYSYPPSELLITWDPNVESDLSHYAVYKGSDEGFVPSEGNRLGTVCDTFFVDDAFDPNVDNYYKLSAWDVHENESGFSLLRQEEITGVGGPPAASPVTLLEQNVPNPFNPVTVIRFSLAEPGWVRLVVFDVAGRPVRTLLEGRRGADTYEATWDGCDESGRAVASGVYLCVLETAESSMTRKMVLLR